MNVYLNVSIHVSHEILFPTDATKTNAAYGHVTHSRFTYSVENYNSGTCARTSDLRDKIKLCATISWPSLRLMTTSLIYELFIIDDRSWSRPETPLDTVTHS